MIKKFENAIKQINSLQKYDEYKAALVFGSIARGGYSTESDLDIIVITKSDREFKILHPYINDIKLDLSYRSFNQLEKEMNDQLKKKTREPMIAGCKILFDKDGSLTKLVNELNQIKPSELTQKDKDDIQFLIYHTNNKVERTLKNDPLSSLLTMHTSINDLLTAHYRINKRWVVSSKKMLEDLRAWDNLMINLLSNFLQSKSINTKYKYWNKILDYILLPIGGRKPLNENIPNEYLEDIKKILN